MLILLGLASLVGSAAGSCPFANQNSDNLAARMEAPTARVGDDHIAKVRAVNWAQVKADLQALTFTDTSNDDAAWPADFGSYGGLFVRLAWHCAGSYRRSDGRGGCDGGRIRMDPEHSWPDNVNLDKALDLLLPIKAKHGDGLSWGDLIILSGTIGQEAMGLFEGKQMDFCAGRIDDLNGDASEALGPGSLQEELFACVDEDGNPTVDGRCRAPLGPTTLGDIYVNPTGQQQLDGTQSTSTQDSADDVRDSFHRMGMGDRETVVLGAGGHTFGKAHGACNMEGGPGDVPSVNPLNPWGNRCPDRGVVSSGLHGAWTFDPTKWDGDYFLYLLEFEWIPVRSPADAFQFNINTSAPMPLGRTGFDKDGTPIVSFLTDLAFRDDPTYYNISADFHYGKNDRFPDYKCIDEKHCGIDAFTQKYIDTWYKLTTRDMGPFERCIWVYGQPEEPAPWQYQLPPAPANPPAESVVRSRLVQLLTQPIPGQVSDLGSNAALLSELAWRCSATFRVSDFLGGCSGSRIRHAPQKDWGVNSGFLFTSDNGIALLDGVKAEFPTMSWADLIVLAGQVAMESLAPEAPQVAFCGGRGDVSDADARQENLHNEYSADLEYRDYVNPVSGFTDQARLWGLSDREMLVLMARPRSAVVQRARGYSGSWSETPYLSNDYFMILLGNQADAARAVWECKPLSGTDDRRECSANGIYMTNLDMALLMRQDLLMMTQEYAADNDRFLRDYAAAWNLMMTNDRFDGPLGNLCRAPAPTPPTPPTEAPQSQGSAVEDLGIVALCVSIGLAVGGGMGMWYNKMFGSKPPSQTDYMGLQA